MTRCIARGLAFLSLAAGPLSAQDVLGTDAYATYVFQGCIQNVSCHTATMYFYHTEFPDVSSIKIDIFSYYLQPSSGITFLNIVPGTGDLDLTGPAPEGPSGCTVGAQSTAGFFDTYAHLPYAPEQISLNIGTCNLPDLYGAADLTLVNSFTTVPEPASLALLAPPALGLIGLHSRTRRKPLRG